MERFEMTQDDILKIERFKLLKTAAEMRLLADKMEDIAKISNDAGLIKTWNTVASLVIKKCKIPDFNYD